jgi:hypothetical protein
MDLSGRIRGGGLPAVRAGPSESSQSVIPVVGDVVLTPLHVIELRAPAERILDSTVNEAT